MRQKVLETLKAACPDVDFEGNALLIEDGVLNSLAVITIIGELNEKFNIEIDADDITVENFNSLDGLTRLVEKKQK